MEIPANSYTQESVRGGSASPISVADHSVDAEELAKSATVKTFIQAPEQFFGKYIELNVEKRTPTEKKENFAVRTEFHGNLQAFFGPVLAEYLYPEERHQQYLQNGAPLTPQCAQKIVDKGIQMLGALASYCAKCFGDQAQELAQPDLLDQAMIRYAAEQEAIAAKQGGIMDLFPHAAKAMGGGVMAAFAVGTMGHLTPTDIFFLADLMADKKLSKSIENFITTKMLQHIEYHLESYLRERQNSNDPLTDQEERNLREILMGSTQTFSHDTAYPSAKSGAIHTAALGMGLAPVHTPLDVLKVIFQGETFGTMGHNQLFRDGVTTLINNVKQIQDSMSKRTAAAEELSKIKTAIAIAQQKAAVAVAKSEGNGISKNVPHEEVRKISTVSVTKQKNLPPPWRRGI